MSFATATHFPAEFVSRANASVEPERERIEALLIEPDPADSEITLNLAANSRQLQFAITVCRSIPEAEELLAQRDFDVIFVEFWLGQSTALPFILMQSTRLSAPCIVLTDLDEPDIRRLAFRAGAEAFLSKDSLVPQALEGVTLAVLGAKLSSHAA